jgi:phosphatidate cytidylyltransferase
MSTAFAHPVTVWIVAATVAVVLGAAAAIGWLSASGRVRPDLRRELWLRLGSWCVLLPLMLGPVLAGREWTIGAVTVLGLLCYREYARATGLFRERLLSAMVVVGILAVNFAALDH